MDNLFDRFNATTESVQPNTDILNGSPLKLNDVSTEKHQEEEKTQSCVIVDKQDGGKETSMQKASGTREDRPSSFVIPKKKRHKTDVLLDVKMSSRDFQHEVLPAITKSYRQPQSCARFNYDQVQLVQNPYLTDAYMEKRRELRGCGYVEKELSDSFAFLCMDTENEEEINKICKEGLHIGNSVDSCLGHPKMGVHLCKHADILKPVGLHSGYTGHIIVFKVMKGKIKSVMENRNGSCLEPTPNHDCHVSSTTGNDLGSLNQRDLYESTQLYLYEYGEENVQDVPRNVCPVAVVRFTYNEIKDVKSPDISSPKFPVRSPLSVKAIQSSTQAKDKSLEQKFVVWSGHLTVKGLYACSVEMVSKAGLSKPSRIGKGINITHKMPIAQARKKYLQKVTSIDRQREGYWNGYYVNVCELHPVKPEGKSHFQKVMNYLGKHNCVAIRKLEKDVVLLLLTASELTFQLGLTKPHQYPVILYSIFLSRTSRKHGAVQTYPLVQPIVPTILPPGQDPRRDKTIPLHISLPPSQSAPHLSDSTKHSTLASPSHNYPSSVCKQMPPPPSPTKGVRAAPRVSPVVGASPPKRWEVSSPPPPLNIPAFYPSQPPSPHAPQVIAPTSPIQGLRSPVHPPLSPLNHWALIPPPPPPSTPPPPTIPLQGQTPQSPHFAPSTRDMVCPYSPIISPMSHPLSPSHPLQYCPPIARPVHLSGVHKDPHDHPRDPRYSTDYPRSPRDQHVRDLRHGFVSPVSIHPVLDGEKSPVLKGPLTSSPQHPTQPPPKLQTPPPSPRYELEGTRFESPRHFSKYPPKTSLLFSDQMKTEFQKQAKTLEEMLAQRIRNKAQTSTKQSNCHFSMSSDSESEMSDTEVNRIVRQLGVPTDESMDTEGSTKGSPNKPLPDSHCIKEVTDMKELLNKRLDKVTEKKTEKSKEMKKQEAEAMLQLLNSAVCAKNQLPKGKIGTESKQKQTFSVRPLPSKNKQEKKDLKTGTYKLKISKTDKVILKKLKEACVHSESTRHKSSKKQEQKTVQPGKCISVTEIKVKNSSQKLVNSANNKKPRQPQVSSSKNTEHGRIQEVKGQISSKGSSRSTSSSCSQSGQSKAEEERNIGKTTEHEKVKEQMSTKSRSRSSSTSLQSGHSKTVANKASEHEKVKEQMSIKSRSRSSSFSSQSGLISKSEPSGSNNTEKTVSKLDTHKPSKKTESGDRRCEKLKTFAEKYEESLKLQQKRDLKNSSKQTATSSKKSVPVITMDKSLPLMTDKSLTQKSPHLEDSKVKNPSNKVRARAYSSSEIENTHGVGEEQMNSAPKKAKLDQTVRDEKSHLWSKVNATAPKKSVVVIDEKQQNSEKKLSFKIKPTKSLVKKEPLGVNKGGKRSLKCGKSSSSSSTSSSAKRSTADAVKEKRKIKSWVGTIREKCSIEDVLPGLYSTDKSKLGRIPKLAKIPKKGQVSSKPDSASAIVSNDKSSSVDSNASPIVHPSSSVIPSAMEMSSTVELPLEVDIAPVQPSSDINASSVIKSSGISFSSEQPNANIAQPAVLESVQNATMESIVSRLPAHVENPSVDSDTYPTDGNMDDADNATEKVLESLVQRSLASAKIEVEAEDRLKSKTLSENISTDLISQQTETKDENRLAGNVEASENDQHDNLMDESEEMHHTLSSLDQNVMINPVPKLDIMEQSSQSSNASSCSSSKNLTVQKASAAQEKRRKYLRKREKAESPVDSMMKSIIRSAAAKHRNSPRGWSDNERSRSPGYKSSDSERSNAAKYNVKTKNNAEIEKNLQKKFDRDHSNAIKLVSSNFLPDVDSNAMCHFASLEISSKAKHIAEQSSGKAASTEHQTPAVENRHDELVVKNQTPSSKRERSITPDIVIPGLGDLPLSDLNPDNRSSNIVFDPLRLSEIPGYSSKKPTQSAKRERSITPEIVIPGLGDLPLKDLYRDSKPSNIVYDPLKLSNTAGYERKETPVAKRERSITPEVVIPGLGDLPLPDNRANIPGLSDLPLPGSRANILGLSDLHLTNNIMGTSESSITTGEKRLKTSIETESTKASCDKDISISTDDLLSIPSVDQSGDASSATALVKDDKSITKKPTVQDNAADDREPVVNNTRVVERAGRELKLRVSVPNNLCGDSSVKLITLDQTIRQTLHGHRQFSRLTPTENVLVTTINRVLHKKLYEGKDKRHVEELNGQNIGNILPKTSNTPTMADLTRNLSPSLVEFARKHLSPTVSDFTRKHDPDVDEEPSDHLSDLMSYESWGVNRNTDNLLSTRDRKPSGKRDNASSTENTNKSKPASPSISASNLKYVPASAFVPKKGSQIGRSFMNNTKLAVSSDASSSIPDSSLPPRSSSVSSESSSNLSDNVTIRTISIAPMKDSPKTVGVSVTDKTIKEDKAHAIPDKFPSEKDKSKDENSVSTRPKTVTSRLSGSTSSSSSAKSVKTSSEGPSAPSTKLSETSVLPKPVSLSSKSTETVSSSASPARSEETVSSKLSSTKTSTSSLQSTKLSENKAKLSGSGGALFSPIRLPDGVKSETVKKTLVPESDKTSQVGAIRSDNQQSRKERKAQSHPYTRRRRRESWSFDIPYRNLQELMKDLTANTFKQKNVDISKPQKSKNNVPRFRNYRFRRSSVPDSLPDSPDDSDEFTPDAIPDFEERKRKADMLENMQSSKKEDQEAYTAEQSSYSPGATTVAKPKPNEGKEKGVSGEENIQERLLRISKMPSPAALTSKAKASTDKDTGQGSKEKTALEKTGQGSQEKTALEKIQSESDSSNNNRKRRISQACSPNRRKDWRLSRIRHNTGQGESTHSQPIDDEMLSRCRKGSSPSDSVKGGKSSQKSSRESTPCNSSVLKQGSREYSPSEFFCGTGEWKASRENTPIDFTQDTDISKETQFVVDVPEVEVVQKKKIKIKRLDAGRSPSLSPVSSKVDDCNNPNMFRPITKPDENSETGDLRDYLQQLKAQKSEHKLESSETSPSAGKRCEKETPENNIKGCSDSEQTSVSGEQTSKENLIVGERESTKDANVSDEDMDDWIVMDEFQCPEASALKDQVSIKEPDEVRNAPNDPENKMGDHAINISEAPVKDIDDVRKDLPSPCSGKIQSDTSVTTEKEFDTSDGQNQVKNKDIVTTIVKEGTKNSEDETNKTDSERHLSRDDNLCTQSKAEKSEEFLSETNEGDKTIIETADMSFSETVNDQFADPSTFVPVIYLSGTKGKKIPWAKELDSSEIGDENAGNDSKEENRPKFTEEAHPSKMKELEETCQSKIDEENDISTEQNNSKSTGEEDNNDVKNTYCSESNPKILSPPELIDANSGQSLSVQKESAPTASQTSKVSTQEQNTYMSEGKREDRKSSVEEEVHVNTKSACDETPEQISTTPDTASSETSRPKILPNITSLSTGRENQDTLVSEDRRINETKDDEVKAENTNVGKTSVDRQVDASGSTQPVVTGSRIRSRNMYGYEEDNSANTSNGSARLNCSWDFTVKQDEDSSESIYGEYHTATKTQNSKGDGSSDIQIGDQFTPVLKVEKISDSNNSSCDNLLLEEKSTEDEKDVDCNHTTIITRHESVKLESETTYSLGLSNMIDVEVQPNRLSGEESVVKVEPTIPNVGGSCSTINIEVQPNVPSVEESVIVKVEPTVASIEESAVEAQLDVQSVKECIVKVEPTVASIEESAVEAQLDVQSVKECIVKVEPTVPNIKDSVIEVQQTVPRVEDKTATAVMSICVDDVPDGGEEAVPSVSNGEVNLTLISSKEGNSISGEEVNIHRISNGEGNIPCIGAEEEIETNINDDDDELLQATKTCALLCHSDMFTSVTGREETTSSGQSSQGSTIKCNLSFEYEHHDKELLDLGEYCADLTYRLDRDIDLNHDIEVESIISSLEEPKDGQDIQVSNGQFDEVKKSDLSLERHQLETLQSKLKPGGGEGNFPKLEHCCPEFSLEDSKFEIGINTGNIRKKSTLAVDLNECFNKSDVDLNSSSISLEATSVDEKNKFQKKLIQPSIHQTVEMNKDTKTLLLKKSTGYCQEESIDHNTNGLVAIADDEEIVPDSQDSDSDEAELVNISSFLKPNDSHNYESDVSFHKHLTDSHQSQSCDSSELKSRLAEKPHYVGPCVKSMKTSTPRVSPVADFFGLQCQTPVAQFTERPCTDYVYGLYKAKSELESEIPAQSTVEKSCKVDSNLQHVQKSPLNLSVLSKPKTSAEIPGMLCYVSPNCSDLADEEVSSHCGVNIKPITFIPGFSTNSNIKLAPPSPLKPKLSCSFEDPHVTVPMLKTEDQGESSVNVLDTSDRNSSVAKIEAPVLESIPDKTVLPKIEDFRLQQNLADSDSDSTIPYCQDSDFDEESLESQPSQDLNSDNQQSLKPCEIVPEQTESAKEQVDISPTPSSLDVPTSIMDSNLVPQPQPAQIITDTDDNSCPSTPMNLSRPSTPLNLSRPSTPLGIASPQPWEVSPPPHYGPNFWPYSPPLGYPPSAYFPYTSPLLQHPNYRIWRPPFYYYPDHIPLQQHGIMPSLDPCMLHWTSAVRQQLQASSLYPSLMLDSRLPLYSSYTYDRSDTHLGCYDQGTSYDVDSAYPDSNMHIQGNLPSYSNTFMQYVVHGQQVLSHSAVVSPRSPPVRPYFFSTTALLSTPRTTIQDELPMVDTPSAFTPIRPSTATTNTELTTDCVVTPENIPLPDHSPIGQPASTVTRNTELTTDSVVNPENVPLTDHGFSPAPSPQTAMESPATLPPISTFARKSSTRKK